MKRPDSFGHCFQSKPPFYGEIESEIDSFPLRIRSGDVFWSGLHSRQSFSDRPNIILFKFIFKNSFFQQPLFQLKHKGKHHVSSMEPQTSTH